MWSTVLQSPIKGASLFGLNKENHSFSCKKTPFTLSLSLAVNTFCLGVSWAWRAHSAAPLIVKHVSHIQIQENLAHLRSRLLIRGLRRVVFLINCVSLLMKLNDLYGEATPAIWRCCLWSVRTYFTNQTLVLLVAFKGLDCGGVM